jgi:hypothetical protein
MNTSRLIIATAMLALSGAAAHAEEKLDRTQENEARLAKMLEGRTPGEPVKCIPAFQADRLQVFEGVAMVYGTGNTLYVARPAQPESLRWDDIVVVNRYGGQLCHDDVVRTVDRMSGFTTGVVFLSKFVPYTKQD